YESSESYQQEDDDQVALGADSAEPIAQRGPFSRRLAGLLHFGRSGHGCLLEVVLVPFGRLYRRWARNSDCSDWICSWLASATKAPAESTRTRSHSAASATSEVTRMAEPPPRR